MCFLSQTNSLQSGIEAFVYIVILRKKKALKKPTNNKKDHESYKKTIDVFGNFPHICFATYKTKRQKK